MNLIKKLFYKHTQRQTMLLELFCYKFQEAKEAKTEIEATIKFKFNVCFCTIFIVEKYYIEILHRNIYFVFAFHLLELLTT